MTERESRQSAEAAYDDEIQRRRERLRSERDAERVVARVDELLRARGPSSPRPPQRATMQLGSGSLGEREARE